MALLLLVLFNSITFPPSVNGDDKERFLEFCTRVTPALRDAYGNCSYESQETQSNGQTIVTTNMHVGDRFVLIRGNPGPWKSDQPLPPFPDGEFLATTGQKLTFITNERYSAMIGVDTDKKPLLRQVTPVDLKHAPGIESVVYACPDRRARLPYLTIAKSTDSKIESFGQADCDGRSTERVVAFFEAELVKEFGAIRCESYFDSKNGHCLKSIVSYGNYPGKMVYKMAYDESAKIPTLRSISMDYDGMPGQHDRAVFRNWQFDVEPPKEQCYLKYYGLPEPPDPNAVSETGIPVWLWVFVTGLSLLMISIFLRHFRGTST